MLKNFFYDAIFVDVRGESLQGGNNMVLKSRKLASPLFLLLLAGASFFAVTFAASTINFLIANLGLKTYQAERVADFIMAGSTVATIIGVLGAASGLGLLIAGSIGTLRAIAKNRGRRALVNF